VRQFVVGSRLGERFVGNLDDLCELLLPAFEAEGKTYLTLAFGCTGGRHRSVCLAEHAAATLRRLGFDPQIQHRDLQR